MTVKIVDGQLVTDLYCKPTDSHSYLQCSSSHPQRGKDSIPYSKFLSVRRISTKVEDFDKIVLVLIMHFLRKGYPMKLLEETCHVHWSEVKTEQQTFETKTQIEVHFLRYFKSVLNNYLPPSGPYFEKD